MDSSQLTRLRHEAANTYISRNKTVDSSFLTFQNQQRAAYAGSARFKTPPYYNGNPTVNPIVYDPSACALTHSFKDGYANLPNSQHQSLVLERGGAAICGDADYSTAPPGIFLLNPSTCSTILSSYNNNAFIPSIPPFVVEVPRYVFPTFLPSIYFSGNSFLQCSTDTVYSGSSDFTIEFYVNPSVSSSSSQTLLYIGIPAIANTYKTIILLRRNTNGNYSINVTCSTCGSINFGELSPGRWYNIAIMRLGNDLICYINGIYHGIILIPNSGIPSNGGTTTYLSGTESITIIGGEYNSGYSGFSNGFNGYITNFRWTKGKALYTYMPHNISSIVDSVEIFKKNYKVPSVPLEIESIQGGYTFLYPYVAVGLLATSASTFLVNTRSPTATVSITDGSQLIISPSNPFTSLSWSIV